MHRKDQGGISRGKRSIREHYTNHEDQPKSLPSRHNNILLRPNSSGRLLDTPASAGLTSRLTLSARARTVRRRASQAWEVGIRRVPLRAPSRFLLGVTPPLYYTLHLRKEPSYPMKYLVHCLSLYWDNARDPSPGSSSFLRLAQQGRRRPVIHVPTYTYLSHIPKVGSSF